MSGTGGALIYLWATIVGAILMGALIGLIPLFLARNKGYSGLGWIFWSLCLLGNFVLGLYLSVPICLVEVVIILIKKRRQPPVIVVPASPPLPGEGEGQKLFCPYCGRRRGGGPYCLGCGKKLD